MSQLFQTPFGHHSTASDVIDGVDLSGRRAIVTGAGSGIGTETARALASAGAEVVLAVRRPQAAGQIAAGIARSTGNTKVSVRALDLADQDSVRSFAAAWDQPLHILVNNAGIMALPEPGLKTPKERQKTIQQGAATSVLLAASPLLDKVGDRYFEDCNEAPVVTRRTADYTGVAWYAVDQANAGRLWDTALDLLRHELSGLHDRPRQAERRTRS